MPDGAAAKRLHMQKRFDEAKVNATPTSGTECLTYDYDFSSGLAAGFFAPPETPAISTQRMAC